MVVPLDYLLKEQTARNYCNYDAKIRIDNLSNIKVHIIVGTMMVPSRYKSKNPIT